MINSCSKKIFPTAFAGDQYPWWKLQPNQSNWRMRDTSRDWEVASRFHTLSCDCHVWGSTLPPACFSGINIHDMINTMTGMSTMPCLPACSIIVCQGSVLSDKTPWEVPPELQLALWEWVLSFSDRPEGNVHWFPSWAQALERAPSYCLVNRLWPLVDSHQFGRDFHGRHYPNDYSKLQLWNTINHNSPSFKELSYNDRIWSNMIFEWFSWSLSDLPPI